MSTGKRLAKRSIIGTRVCAPDGDGKYFTGVIQSIMTPGSFPEANNSIVLTPSTRYSVRFDVKQGSMDRKVLEFLETQIIGPGFKSVVQTQLVPGQKAYVTYNNREVTGEVIQHDSESDVVVIKICPPGSETFFEVQKRLEEVRLLESRKSARLADQDTDFAILADVSSADRKRQASQTIDVPIQQPLNGSRKRGPSCCYEDDEMEIPDGEMDECNAALVLMSLSVSPHSPNLNIFADIPWTGTSPGSGTNSSSSSCRLSPSPPPREANSPNAIILSSSATSEESLSIYLERRPRKKMTISRIIFQCTWPGCQVVTNECEIIEAHIRKDHLNCDNTSDHEEEFYYTEREVNESSPPTLSHRDMARPPHEDPDYQRRLVGSIRQQMLTGPITIPQSPHKLPKLSPRPKTPTSPRRTRSESKKCRKVYGMENRDMWCTQCKWKKACTRFGSDST